MSLGGDGWYWRVAYNPYCPGIMELVAPKAAGRAFCRWCVEAAQCTCLLMALFRHSNCTDECPLLGVKRT
jgi:hypothetical protein